jgi:nitrogen regulatory protein P-II 1
MNFKKITAFIRSDQLKKVEAALQKSGIKGMSVSKTRGFGEYVDFYMSDGMTEHTRLEIFITSTRAEAVAEIIIEAAHVGIEGDGIVAIAPVDNVYRIRTKSAM